MLRTTASFRMFTTPFVVWMIRSAAQTVHVFIRHTNAVPTPHVHGHAPLLTHIQCTHMSLPSPPHIAMFLPLHLHVRSHANACARMQTRANVPCTFPCTCMCHCICPSRTTVPCHVAFHSLLLSCVASSSTLCSFCITSNPTVLNVSWAASNRTDCLASKFS